MPDTWLVNNTPLETLAVAISVDEGLQQAPEWRDRDLEIPGAHGVIDYGADLSGPRRSFGPGQITFSGWVKGVDPTTGYWAGDEGSMAAYYARVSELMRLFYARNLVIDHIRPDGTRRAVGRIFGSLAPARERASPWFGRFKAVVRIPGAFWSGAAPLTVATPPSGVVSGTGIGLGGLAAGEAPIADALLTFGPGNNPSLIQGGAFFAWDGVIAAGRQLTVDVAAEQLGYGSGTEWSPEASKVRYNPGPAWFELDPTGGSTVTLNHTGGSLMYAALTARPKYLTS